MKMASSARWNRFTVFAQGNSFTGSRSPQFGRAYPWCKAQRGQAEYDRLAALCINAGRSNPQQGFVCRGRAKVRCRRRYLRKPPLVTEGAGADSMVAFERWLTGR